MSNWANTDASVPVADKDRAQTFSESDVSLAHSSTEARKGLIGLVGSSGNTTSISGTDTTTTDQSPRGVVVNPNTDMGGVLLSLSSNLSGVNSVELAESDGTTIHRKTSGLSAGGTVKLYGDLVAGTDYHVLVDASTMTYRGNSYPYTGTDLDVVAGISGGNASTAYPAGCVTSVSSLVPPSSGSVTVEWPMPADLYAWDTGVFEVREDGETADVYVEEEQSAGSWTEIAGPINRGASIKADPSNNVRYRIDFASSSGGWPELRAIYRRFKL